MSNFVFTEYQSLNKIYINANISGGFCTQTILRRILKTA